VGGLFAILKLTMSPASTLPQLSETTNLWQQSDFDVYSLSYLPSGANPVSYQSGQAGVVLLGNETSQSGITSKSLSIILDKTIKFESLVAHRYAVYRSDTGYPVFYDTVENCQVDLQERILGDTDWIYLEFMAAAEKKAEELYPGILHSDTNRKLLWQYLYGIIQDMDLSGVVAQQPDTAFMDYLADKPDEDPEYRNTLFWDMCWAAYAYAETDLQGEMCCMQILAIDAVGGICIIRVQDVYGNGCQYLTYDITTDTNYALDIDTNLLEINKQYNIVFSEGGLHFRGSDEHTESLTNTIGKWSVGIGSYDINDKCYYTDEPHKGYDVWKNENGYGFSFILLDRSVKKITFLVAWIEKLPDSNIDFEDALDFWLT
jgi:hypothetical protein